MGKRIHVEVHCRGVRSIMPQDLLKLTYHSRTNACGSSFVRRCLHRTPTIPCRLRCRVQKDLVNMGREENKSFNTRNSIPASKRVLLAIMRRKSRWPTQTRNRIFVACSRFLLQSVMPSTCQALKRNESGEGGSRLNEAFSRSLEQDAALRICQRPQLSGHFKGSYQQKMTRLR